MMTRGLVLTGVGIFFALGLDAFASAAHKRIGFAAPAVTADEIGQIRGGMSVVPELSGIVVLAGVPPQARRGISKPDFIGGLTGVPQAVRGISEALVTTAAGVKERIGQIAAGVRAVRSAALQQGRVLLDSD